MTCRGKAVVLVATVLLLTGSIAGWSTPIINDSMGTVLSKADGSVVTLDFMRVLWCGKSGKSCAIKAWDEPSSQQPRLLLVSISQLPLENYWTLNATGIIQTLTSTTSTGATFSQRVVIVTPNNVSVYCDVHGKPLNIPLFKRLCDDLSITTRPLAISLVDSISRGGSLPVLPDTPDAPLPAKGSRDSIKSLQDGANVSLNGAIVSASFGNRFCIQRQDRSFATWVKSSQPITVGSLVDISGTMSTEAGMRILTANSVTTLDTGYSLPEYCGMNNRDVWHNLDVTGLDTSGYGVRVWGKVTEIDSNSTHHAYYISDGSILPTPGVRIKDHTTDTLPSVNDFVVVSGMSGTDTDAPGVRTVHKYSSDPGVTIYTSAILASQGVSTISGTITAAGADGNTVRVYCGKASTTATFSGGAASYTLRVPSGTYAVTVSALGYKTTTKRVVVNGRAVSSAQDFRMPVLERRLDIASTPSGNLADGSCETAVTAIVRDEEGRRYASVPVRWNLPGGTIFSADAATNAVGEAKAVIRHGMSVDSACIEVEAGAVIGRSIIE